MIRTILTLIIALLGLLNCNKNVRYQASVAPKQFPSSSQVYKSLDNLPYVAWWQQFHDPELNRLIESSLQHNLDIHVALANVQQAKGELLQVKLSWLPTIQLLAGYSTNPALGVPGGFYAIWPYYVVNIMKLYSQGKQASYNVQYYRAAVDGARLAVIGQVASAYFTLMAQQEQKRLLLQLDQDLKRLIQVSKDEIKVGLDNDIALAQLQSDERLIAAEIKPVLHNIVYSQNALRFLINENPGTVQHKKNFAQLDFSRFKPGSLPATVLNYRPDLKMAIYSLKSADAGKLVAWSDFFPTLQLDELVGEIHLPHGFFAQVTDAYADLDFMPSSIGNIFRSRGLYQAKQVELVKTIKQILREVDNGFSANKRMNEQFAIYQNAEAEYAHKYKLQKGLKNTGLISYKELLQSKINLDSLALRTNQAKLELAISLVVLYEDLAGGYAYEKEGNYTAK